MFLKSLERKGTALEFSYFCFDHFYCYHHYRLLDLDHEPSKLQYDALTWLPGTFSECLA